ncbi:hypothetical protein L7F22_047092 [Adiantum nelumboides]|nr:hypothetical protein [Adiantum nelumboides]
MTSRTCLPVRRKRAKKKKTVRVKKGRGEGARASVDAMPAAVAGLHDNWDDADGYYRITLGERIGENGRYQVFANLGRGMFSSVVKARDTVQGGESWQSRSFDPRRPCTKAGVKEIAVLIKLAEMETPRTSGTSFGCWGSLSIATTCAWCSSR